MKYYTKDSILIAVIAHIKLHPVVWAGSCVTYIVGLLSPAIARRATVCIGIWYRKQLQGLTIGCGTSVRGSHINLQALQKLAEDSEEVAELAGRHHLYRFELEDTTSADHFESSNEDRLVAIL